MCSDRSIFTNFLFIIVTLGIIIIHFFLSFVVINIECVFVYAQRGVAILTFVARYVS